jgi:hypothetical protein
MVTTLSLSTLYRGYDCLHVQETPHSCSCFWCLHGFPRNTFQCAINETLIRDIADAMISSGLNKVGYECQTSCNHS